MGNAGDDSQTAVCHVCGNKGMESLRYDSSGFARDIRRFRCRYCGTYAMKKLVTLQNRPPNSRLCAVVRDYWERNEQPLLITHGNYEDLLKLAPARLEVSEKVRRLLLAIARKSEFPGSRVPLDPTSDYPLAFCANEEEFKFYLHSLQERRLISLHKSVSLPKGPPTKWECEIRPDGWDLIESYKRPNIESEKAFVAMWFCDETESAYKEGMEPAIEEDCGYRALRIDLKEFLGDIVDEILAEIRESRFVVADFTGQRQGVYYEAGFAHGLGLPVIPSCRENDIKNLHFDTRQQNHIVWNTPEDLRAKLANRIRHVIGFGPRKADEPFHVDIGSKSG